MITFPTYVENPSFFYSYRIEIIILFYLLVILPLTLYGIYRDSKKKKERAYEKWKQRQEYQKFLDSIPKNKD